MQEQLSRYQRLLEGTALKLPDGGLQLRQKVRSLEASIAEMGSRSAQPGPTRSAEGLAAILQDTELLGVHPKGGSGGRDGLGTSGGQAGPGGGGDRAKVASGGGKNLGARVWNGTGRGDGTGAGSGHVGLGGGGGRGRATSGGAGNIGASRSGSMPRQPPPFQPPLEAIPVRGVQEGRLGEAPQLQHAVKIEPRTQECISELGPSQPAPADLNGIPGPSDQARLPKGGVGLGSSGRGGGGNAGVSPTGSAKMPPHTAPVAQLATAMMTPFPDEQQAARQVRPPAPKFENKW